MKGEVRIGKYGWRKGVSYRPPWELVYMTMWLAANGLFSYYHITEEFGQFCAGCGKTKSGGLAIVNLPFNHFMAVCDGCTEKTKGR